MIVYTGKGGVGKTSVAAATAILCAERGLRTLVMSTDIAHSLGDAFGRTIGPEPKRLSRDLWAQETDAYHKIRASWGAIQEYLTSFFQWRGLDEVLADEMTVIPGLDEIASLIDIVDHFDSERFDVIIVDAAPTGETLRLLSLPEAARWWLDRVLPLQRRAAQIARPVLRRFSNMPVPDDAVFGAGADLFRKLDRMHELLSDPSTTSMRIVLNLEKMVIAEAWRSFTYFHLFGYATDLVICNRVLPKNAGPYFAAWQDTQQRYWPTVIQSFAPVPVRQAPFFAREVVGTSALRKLGSALFDKQDPTKFFYRGKPYRVERENGGFALSVELPFVAKADVEVRRHREELVLQVGSWRRNLILPRALADIPTRGAKLRDGVLRVYFASAEGR
ncbi:MAG TPA: ArsA family ATPase [Candidatus Limnocylindria bacterium]|nr:ArsA family ATPase [Candidatus Limnocylindria bacterium]